MRAILFFLVAALSFSVSIDATHMRLDSDFVDRWRQKFSKFEEIYESKPREQKFLFGGYQLRLVAHVKGKEGWFRGYDPFTPIRLSVYFKRSKRSWVSKFFDSTELEESFSQGEIPFLVLDYFFDEKKNYYVVLQDFGTPTVFSPEQVMELLRKLQIELRLPSIYMCKDAYQEGYFYPCFVKNCIKSERPHLDPNWIYLFMQEKKGAEVSLKRSFFESFGAVPVASSSEKGSLYLDAVEFLNRVTVKDLIRDYRAIQQDFPLCESLAEVLEDAKTKLSLKDPGLTVGGIVRALEKRRNSDNKHMHRLYHQFHEKFFGQCANFFLDQAYHCFTEVDNPDVYDFQKGFADVLKDEIAIFVEQLKEFGLDDELTFSAILENYSDLKKQLLEARVNEIKLSAFWMEPNDPDAEKKASDFFCLYWSR